MIAQWIGFVRSVVYYPDKNEKIRVDLRACGIRVPKP